MQLSTEALAFSVAYAVIVIVMIIGVFKHMYDQRKKSNNIDNFEYGTLNNKKARRHTVNKNVQFVLWKKGEQGHTEDYWINSDSSWWSGFIKDSDDAKV